MAMLVAGFSRGVAGAMKVDLPGVERRESVTQ